MVPASDREEAVALPAAAEMPASAWEEEVDQAATAVVVVAPTTAQEEGSPKVVATLGTQNPP